MCRIQRLQTPTKIKPGGVDLTDSALCRHSNGPSGPGVGVSQPGLLGQSLYRFLEIDAISRRALSRCCGDVKQEREALPLQDFW